MMLLYVLGFVVFAAIAVVGFLFYLLSQESVKELDVKAEPIANPAEVLGVGQVKVDEQAYAVKVEQLQDQIKTIAIESAAQVQQAEALAQQLSRENELLREEHRKASERQTAELTLVQQQVEQLRQTNGALQTQLAASESRLRQVQDEGVALRNQMDDELAQSEAVIAEYKRTLPKTEDSLKEMEELRSQVEALRQEVHDHQLTNSKLKEFNQHLIEKSEALQYELVKHRAQASGLERICERYKMELEKRI